MRRRVVKVFGHYETDERGRVCYRPPIPEFPKLEDVWPQFERANRALTDFDRALASFPIVGTVGKLFARLDAVHSSGAEGTTTTFADLLEYQTSLKIAKAPEDARVVFAAAQAFDEISAMAEASYIELLLAIHKRLFEKASDPVLAASAGKIKTYPNGTYDHDAPSSIFHFTAPASTLSVLREWEEFTAAKDNRPELLRQALSHWMFEHIHPVMDGNGRVGRLLVPLLMQKKGATQHACAFLGEAAYFDKNIYVESLKAGRRTGDLTQWSKIFFSMVEQTAITNLKRLEELNRIYSQWLAATEAIRTHSVAHRLIPWIIVTPTFTLKDAMNFLGGSASFQAANNGVQRLEMLGVISQTKSKTKERLFTAPSIIKLFSHAAPSPSPE
jgi:Fic family protein